MIARILFEQAPLLGLLLVAAVIDVRQRRIPNWLTFGLILSGLARAAAFGIPGGPANALAGLLAGAAVPLVLFILGALGGGDVKLLAGIGAWVGPRDAFLIFAIQCVIGMLLVLCQALRQGRTAALFRNSALLAVNMSQRGIASCAEEGKSFRSIDRPLPYAVPVGLATLLVLLAPI
jgi:prepilin peptidase CpaA